MDNPRDPFAPLTEAERADALAQSEGAQETQSATLICPPANAEPGPSAAARLCGRKPDAAWRYVTAEGETAFHVLRWNEGEGAKTFRPLSWREGEGLAFAAWPANRPLYNLPAIIDQADAPIIVCEGEKAADAAARIFPESIATTSSGGAGTAAKSDWSPLARRGLLIWPDNDAAGGKFANEVAAMLAGLEADVSIVDARALAAIDPAGGRREPADKWDAADAAAEWPDLAALRRAAANLSKPYEPGPRYLSHGAYKMTATGLEVEAKRKLGDKGEAASERISSPFEILGHSRNSKGGDWGLYLKWRDGDGRAHTRLVAYADLHGEPGALCQSLVADGLKIERSRQRALADYLNGAATRRRVTRVETTGWHSISGCERFVLPGETIGPPTAETIILDAGASAPYETRGTLADWQDCVGKLASRQTLPMLAISTALAGSLLNMAGGEGGGVHFFGVSSRGKTTILQAAASIWGRGATPGYVRTWRATGNGLEGAAALATDTALVLDEMGVLDARDAAAAIYSLANGGGKQRAARNGDLREPKSWRVVIISSGEIPFEAKLTEGRNRARAGQTIRLLDIPADRGLGFGAFDHADGHDDAGALARAIKQGASEAYGTAGPEFVRRLIREAVNGSDVRASVADFVKQECPARADGQIERVAQRFGLIAAAGELATALAVTPWGTGEAIKAAAWAFKAWLDNRGGAGSGEARQALSAVRLYLIQHGDSRFDPADDLASKPSLNRAGWRKGEGEEREWYIPPDTWKAEICEGLDAKAVALALADLGHLHRINDGFLAVRRVGGRNVRVYVVGASILAGGDDDA